MKKNLCLRKVIIKRALLGFVLLSALCILPAIEKISAADVSVVKATDLERIITGRAAPDFSLESEEGNRVTLSSYQKQKNVILVFYRGYW